MPRVATLSIESALLTLFGSLFAAAFTTFFVFYCVRRCRDRRRHRLVPLDSPATTKRTEAAELKLESSTERISKSLNIADMDHLEHSRVM